MEMIVLSTKHKSIRIQAPYSLIYIIDGCRYIDAYVSMPVRKERIFLGRTYRKLGNDDLSLPITIGGLYADDT
jgi:hypothetical protein